VGRFVDAIGKATDDHKAGRTEATGELVGELTSALSATAGPDDRDRGLGDEAEFSPIEEHRWGEGNGRQVLRIDGIVEGDRGV
jgi:hypothetical protein